MIRRALLAGAGVALPLASYGVIVRRAADRVFAARRRAPGEEALGPALDALGGEVVRIRSRDGLRLSARWLPAVPPHDGAWRPDPRDAIVVLHGWSGSVAPDLVEFGPFLRRTAGVLGLDFRGHGDSDESPTTFGLREVDDVGGALAWLGERGIRRVALFGTSMGSIVALASVAVLGDGSLTGADADPAAPAAPLPAPRPQIVAVVAESVPAELPTVVAGRMPARLPAVVRRRLARRVFATADPRFGGDPRATEPIRIAPLVGPVPVLLISGAADELVPVDDGRRLATALGSGAEWWLVPGARHSRAHEADSEAYETRVTAFLRRALGAAQEGPGDAGILAPARPLSPIRGAPVADEPDQGG
ncbi:MAG TPA: alpha/beta hydrolase [Candidatus Limnocylindrales bacterium]|nr:alpha/beta hydrolase [Candidatus Limnocylindrales bacterium]